VTYISVPYTAWESVGGSPLRTTGIQSVPAPASAGQGDARGSLGYPSITYTPPKDSTKIPLLSDLISVSCKNPLIPNTYGFLIDAFYKWAVITENYWISIKTIKPACKCVPGKSWGYSFDAKPLHNRFSNERRLHKLGKVYEIMRFEEKQETKVFTLLTLTARHDDGWRATMDRLIFGRDHLLMILRKYLPGVRYVWVAEPHPGKDGEGDLGYPHFHLVLPERVDNTVKDSQGRGLEDKLRDYWDTKWKLGSHTFGLDFEVIEDSNKVLNYILKYVGKSFTNERGWSPAELIFNANLFGAAQDEDNPVKYRAFGMCNEYNRLFPKKNKEPSVCLDARLFPITQEGPDGQEYPERIVWDRPQLIPDWFGNINLIDSILKGNPDYTIRTKYDKTGKIIERVPDHWGRVILNNEPELQRITTPEEYRRLRKQQQDGYL
jgi:hypothetical protein